MNGEIHAPERFYLQSTRTIRLDYLASVDDERSLTIERWFGGPGLEAQSDLALAAKPFASMVSNMMAASRLYPRSEG